MGDTVSFRDVLCFVNLSFTIFPYPMITGDNGRYGILSA